MYGLLRFELRSGGVETCVCVCVCVQLAPEFCLALRRGSSVANCFASAVAAAGHGERARAPQELQPAAAEAGGCALRCSAPSSSILRESRARRPWTPLRHPLAWTTRVSPALSPRGSLAHAGLRVGILCDILQLSKELRADVIYNVCNTGGHLGSSLGVIELTVALHNVFDLPEDKVRLASAPQTHTHTQTHTHAHTHAHTRVVLHTRASRAALLRLGGSARWLRATHSPTVTESTTSPALP